MMASLTASTILWMYGLSFDVRAWLSVELLAIET
jgi:hypothetical protein